jgi:hypothetical protein
MKNVKLICVLLLIAVAAAFGDEPVSVTHWQFQAVYPDGSSSFDDDGPWQVVLEGILLNNPEEFIDPTSDPTISPWFMGGQWQVWIQGEGSDHAGTACWMGQNYANGPGDDSYTNEEWLSEICRLNHDPNTGYVFHAGDRIRVTGTYLFYAGKLNINENHETDPLFDFAIELVKPAVGLPQPEEIGISDLKDATDSFIFDSSRLTGCEYYQGRLVRIQDVNIIDPQNWGSDETITIKSTDGRTFPVLLGIGSGISKYNCPTGRIDVIGILDQEGGGYPPNLKGGYRLVVLNYDGNRLVLGDTGHPRGNLPGDINKDYIVDFKDFAELAENWLKNRAGLYNCGL